MRGTRRLLVALLGAVVLVSVVAVAAELLVRHRVERALVEETRRSLDSLAEVQGTFEPVEASVEGFVLPAVARGSFDVVTVTTGGGTIDGVPVRALTLRASDVAVDGSGAGSVSMEGRVAAAEVVQLVTAPDIADEAAAGTRAVPPDAIAVDLPIELPVLSELSIGEPLLVTVEYALAVSGDGVLRIEPRSVVVADTGVNLAELLALPVTEIGTAELPGDLVVSAARVEQGAAGAEVVLTASCRHDCVRPVLAHDARD